MAVKKKSTVTSTKKTSKKVTGTTSASASKKAEAIKIYNQQRDKSRANVLPKLMSKLDLSKKAGHRDEQHRRADDAFGEHRDGMFITVDQKRIQAGLAPEIGQSLWTIGANDRMTLVTVAEVDGRKITLDTNHPLAGKVITFEIHLIGIL